MNQNILRGVSTCICKQRIIAKVVVPGFLLITCLLFISDKVCTTNKNITPCRCLHDKVKDDLTLPVVYIITPTYTRASQCPELTRMAQTLMLVPRVHWIVVEDWPVKTPFVTELLHRTPVQSTHLCITTPSVEKIAKVRGFSQRNLALSWIKDHATDGIIYFADDDNTYSLELFSEIRKTTRIGVLPSGYMKVSGVSSPIVKGGKVVGFLDCYIHGRKFPLDMASIAINIPYWLQRNATLFNNPKLGHIETRLLEAMGVMWSDLEPLAEDCTKTLVWHTQTKVILAGKIKIDSVLEDSNVPKLLENTRFTRNAGYVQDIKLYELFKS